MGNAIRATVDESGQITVTDQMQISAKSGSPEPTPAPRQEGAIRVQVDNSDGSIRVLENHATGYKSKSISDRGVQVRGPGGRSLTLAQATESDVVDLPGIGNTTVGSAVQNNWLRPSASGKGYELVGAQQGAPEQQNEEAQQDAPPALNPEDVRGVPGTSAEADATLATFAQKAPNALDGALESIARGVDPTRVFEVAAQQVGDENFVASARAMHQEFITSGQAVLKNVGVPEGNFEAFENWARRVDPDAASNAVRDLVKHRSVSKLADLGRAYVQARETSLEQKLSSMNVPTTRIEGALYVSRASLGLPNTPARGVFKGSPWISAKDAEKQGHLQINE
jgi:hypothetical protein